ncbi:MAG: FGGY family carbohydrate kinase [Bacteroidota bacterium]
MYLLGFDIGSSSVKAALVSIKDTSSVAMTQSPKIEMEISAPQAGWAEQDPRKWWHHLCMATHQLSAEHPEKMKEVKAIGLSYQMHGLVLLDEQHEVLRPSIIWCDSRAVEIGEKAFHEMGKKECLYHMLNSPGNFTASKLRWVQENEPAIYDKASWAMLPGDYIASRLCGTITTTASGLSEGILWDFRKDAPADLLLDYYDLNPSLIPQQVPTFGIQGKLSASAAEALGLPAGIPLSYRAGDQPNNALSLNVLHPGELAATGGTSGVVYGVVEEATYDPQSRVNGFLHVNHQKDDPRIGILLCINGAGIQYSWLRKLTGGENISYQAMGEEAASIAIGAEGLCILPFGNGAERMLGNKEVGAQIHNLNFNQHSRAHLYRAGLEGIAFSFVYGLEILQEMGLEVKNLKVDSQNLFQSPIFGQTIANLSGAKIEMLDTNGAVGAARGAGYGAGIYASLEEAVGQQKVLRTYQPEQDVAAYESAYQSWKKILEKELVEQELPTT